MQIQLCLVYSNKTIKEFSYPAFINSLFFFSPLFSDKYLLIYLCFLTRWIQCHALVPTSLLMFDSLSGWFYYWMWIHCLALEYINSLKFAHVWQFQWLILLLNMICVMLFHVWIILAFIVVPVSKLIKTMQIILFKKM